MEGISLQLLERRICEINGMLSEVQSMKDYLLKKQKEEQEKATVAPINAKHETK